MRTIRNLVWFALAFALTVWAGLATAAAPTTQYQTLHALTDGKQAWLPSVADVCAYDANGYNLGRPSPPDREYSCGDIEGRNYYMNWKCLRSTCGTVGSVVNRRLMNTAPSRQWCVWSNKAPDMTKPLNDRCLDAPAEPEPEPPAPCPEDSPGVSFWPSGDRDKPVPAVVAPANTPGCVSGCFVKGVNVRNCKSYGDNPRVYCEWETVTTGARCTAGDPQYENPPEATPTRQDVPPFDSPQGPCPKGTVNGGISDTGLQRCIGTGSDPKNKPPSPPKTETEKTETADDGTKTTTKTEVTTNSDGSKTTTTTVTITKPDGTKQVDQQKDTSKTPTNAPGKDDSTKDDEKYDLCKQNPHLTICQNSTVAGKCGEISCTGDAIQCATLRAAAAMQCKQQTDEEALKASPLTALGQAAIDGTDLNGLPSPTNGEVVSIPTLESQGWLGNGAAFTDVSISLQGHQVLLPLSKVTEYLLPLRYVLMLVASLVSYRILAGAILKE